MNTTNSSLLRSIVALLLGIFLAIWPDVALKYLVQIIGIVFLISGLIATISYFKIKKEHPEMTIPLAGIGSLLLGICLFALPGFFTSFMMYVLAIILLIGGGSQIIELYKARKAYTISFAYYIVPILIFSTGLFIIFDPMGLPNIMIRVFGIAAIIYCISEIINYFKFKV